MYGEGKIQCSYSHKMVCLVKLPTLFRGHGQVDKGEPVESAR